MHALLSSVRLRAVLLVCWVGLLALQQFSRKLVAEMRTFVHRMRPIETDSSSLMAATRRLVEAFQKERGIAVTFMHIQA
mgnify:CR=1 FL=1